MCVAAGYADINLPGCGDRPFFGMAKPDDPLAKVVGGNQSLPGDHAWQIALLRNGAFICGGSIISKHCVLCAAHCTQLTTLPYIVRRTSQRAVPNSWSQSLNVNRIINHPSYSSSTYNNDISILCSNSEFDFTPDEVGHICVADEDPVEDEMGIATGFGSTFSGGSVVDACREAHMPVTREAAIRVQYGNSYNPVTMIGAAYQGDGLDTCQGDSGGPFSCASKGHSNLRNLDTVGIVSWGYGCGGIGIYTRVATYFHWIRQHVLDHHAAVGK